MWLFRGLPRNLAIRSVLVKPSYVLGPVREVGAGARKTCGLSVVWTDYCRCYIIIKICKEFGSSVPAVWV